MQKSGHYLYHLEPRSYTRLRDFALAHVKHSHYSISSSGLATTLPRYDILILSLTANICLLFKTYPHTLIVEIVGIHILEKIQTDLVAHKWS